MQLPDKITLVEFGGSFESFHKAVYEIFKKDFVDSKPTFEGKKLKLKKYPIVDDKEYTFYHFTHDGENEDERQPNLRRMERIGFIKPMINNSKSEKLKVWRNKRGTKERILIYHEEESFLVVLEDRGEYILPWTAYYVEHNFRRKKLLAEYDEYIKTKTAQGH